jgi:hypothetical protein
MSTPQTLRIQLGGQSLQCHFQDHSVQKRARANAEALFFYEMKCNFSQLFTCAFAILKAQRRYRTYISDLH